MLRILSISLAALALVVTVWLVDCNEYALRPDPVLDASAREVPLDPASPWPKFRADARQTGRSAVRATPTDSRPWTFATGKGVFSSPVVDADGTAYIGSADHVFYAIRADGSLAWKFLTGEIIDSSALLDDRGRVYVPSGDAHLYALDRATGRELWRFRAHTPEEVEKLHGIEVFNLDWWEGNVAILPDGTLLAGNDNYLYYRIDRDTGKERGHWLGNELGWSLPALNVRTGRAFFGTMFVALRNLFAFDVASGEKLWSNGALGSIVGSPLLTSSSADGAVVAAGFDGWVRAFGQENGRQIWRTPTRYHVYASPAQLSDGRIVIASTDGTLRALDPENGAVVWAFDSLAPIRSSPAVDGDDRIYFGSGDGRLVALDPDGTPRWSYRCIEGDRDDLNGSPALGPHGIHIGGEDGSICFVPWEWCRSDAGRGDARCTDGGGEGLPDDGARLYWTSWNQIGFDSIRWLGGIAEGQGDRAVVWFVGGRHDGATGRAVVDPANETRFALVLDWDDGLFTLRDAGPFTLDFNGSWGMPYRSYRIATRAAADGRVERRPALNAVADCDAIENYGPFLKLLGLSAWDTGLMHIYGGADLSLWDGAPQALPEGIGTVAIEVGATESVARVAGGQIRRGAHAVGLLLVDASTGLPIPLSYAFATAVESDADGVVTAVRVRYEPGTIRGPVRAHYMIDTRSAFVATIEPVLGGASGTP